MLKKLKPIGVYRKCDWVTMTGTASAIFGIILASNGKTMYAIFALIFSAICDAFDGVVARKFKSLKDYEVYGIELDSLNDAIAFGVLPMMIVKNMSYNNIYTTIISIFFCITGVIRLAYFNMLSTTKKSNGKEFIDFDDSVMNDQNFNNRVRYYYLFQDKIGRNKGKIIAILSKIEHYSLKFQKFLKIDRLSSIPLEIHKGAQWFSITHELAVYILSQRRDMKKYFKFSMCSDELLVQTIVWNSQFKDRITFNNLRYIDWKRGNPYTFRMADLESLITSNCFFARKFDENIDLEVVETLKTIVLKELQ